MSLALAGCAAGGSSSTERQPLGPSPAVTVVVRLGVPGASSVELVGLGADPVALERATHDIAGLVVDPADVGTVVPGVSSASASPESGQDPLISTSVPITVPDQAFSVVVSSDAIATSLADIRPRSTDVWVCTDTARTLQVSSQAPGAVSTDVVSGSCQSAGSSLLRDGVTWTATAAIGPVAEPSKLPWLIGIAVAIALAIGVALYLRARRRDEDDPILAPVH
jgi:hypothetical protein